MNGTVKFFDKSKDFGFITAEDGKEIFVHQSALDEGVTLDDNDSVTFDVEEGDRGPKAVNVKKESGPSGDDSGSSEDESASSDAEEEAPEADTEEK